MSLQTRIGMLISAIGADVKSIQTSLAAAYSPTNPPPSGLLAYTTRTVTSGAASYTVANANAATDVDATNLAITFTVPASGVVIVRLEGTMEILSGSPTARVYWSLRSSTTNVATSERLVISRPAPSTGTLKLDPVRVSASMRISGLTPGASVTYKWAARTLNAVTASLLYGQGTGTSGEFGTLLTNNGPLTMEVWAAI